MHSYDVRFQSFRKCSYLEYLDEHPRPCSFVEKFHSRIAVDDILRLATAGRIQHARTIYNAENGLRLSGAVMTQQDKRRGSDILLHKRELNLVLIKHTFTICPRWSRSQNLSNLSEKR